VAQQSDLVRRVARKAPDVRRRLSPALLLVDDTGRAGLPPPEMHQED